MKNKIKRNPALNTNAGKLNVSLMNPINFLIAFNLLFAVFSSCSKNDPAQYSDPGDLLAIDSLVASKTNIVIWEQIEIKAYTRGDSIKFHWYTNHGSMMSQDSSTVIYWACPSCVGDNEIICEVSNAHGLVADTLYVHAENE